MFLVSLFCVGVLLIRMALLVTGGAVRADGFTAFIVSSPLFEWGTGCLLVAGACFRECWFGKTPEDKKQQRAEASRAC